MYHLPVPNRSFSVLIEGTLSPVLKVTPFFLFWPDSLGEQNYWQRARHRRPDYLQGRNTFYWYTTSRIARRHTLPVRNGCETHVASGNKANGSWSWQLTFAWRAEL